MCDQLALGLDAEQEDSTLATTAAEGEVAPGLEPEPAKPPEEGDDLDEEEDDDEEEDKSGDADA